MALSDPIKKEEQLTESSQHPVSLYLRSVDRFIQRALTTSIYSGSRPNRPACARRRAAQQETDAVSTPKGRSFRLCSTFRRGDERQGSEAQRNLNATVRTAYFPAESAG